MEDWRLAAERGRVATVADDLHHFAAGRTIAASDISKVRGRTPRRDADEGPAQCL